MKTCKSPGCDRIHYGRGYCKPHHMRFLRGGEEMAAKPIRRKDWSKKEPNHLGYIDILVDGKVVAEHRHVMSQHLGRPLLRSESVHHKNGIRHDNSLDNLELWVTYQPSGQRVEDLLTFVIDNYANELLARLQE